MLKHPGVHWALAVLIAVGAMAYQRVTGPTHARRVSFSLAGETHRVKLVRSHGGDTDCTFELDVPDEAVTGTVRYRRYPTNENWEERALERKGANLVVVLPHQPPAGKLEYVVKLSAGDETSTGVESSTVIRFKGGVPAGVLVPHIILMILTTLIVVLAGVKALAGGRRWLAWALVAYGCMIAGGLVFGPILQKYAFGDYWTGVPFGWDLTDNKVALGFLVWTGAMIANVRKRRPVWVVVAAAVWLAINLIPHSAMGSELDPATGEVITG
jgi:hypothetical protein